MQLSLRIGIGRTTWAVLLLIVLSAPVLEAAEWKRVAFVVGIGTYDHLSSDKQLRNAVNDADGVSAKLTEIGFRVTKAPNLTRQLFNAEWQKALDGLTPEDTFVLFFSGHGVQIDGENYLLPRDIPFIEYGKQERLKRESISVNELLGDLTMGTRPHPKRAVVILDACRDNPLIPPGYKSIGAPSGLAKPSSTEGLFVIYAAVENSVSLDRLPSDEKSVKYSVFTRTLLPLLTRQDLTLQGLSVTLKKEVSTLAKNGGRRQLPSYYDGTDGEPFCFPGCAVQAEKGSGESKGNRTATVPPVLSQEITGKDGAPMVLIPAGSFQMGSTKNDVDRAIQTCVKDYKQDQQDCEGMYKLELPQHKVQLDAFYLDKYELTNRLFHQFVQQTAHRTTTEQEGSAWGLVEGKGWGMVKGANWQKPEASTTIFDSGRMDHPVVAVSWGDAQAYCRWAGKRLPTEAEFEYATRAGTKTQYWWGQGNPGSRRVENIADESTKHLLIVIMPGYDDGAVRTAPVGSYEVNPWGLYDISGNVREWTADWYDSNYYSTSPARNPKGPSSGEYRVLRGGSWDIGPDDVRSADRVRIVPEARGDSLGFRCAQDIPK